MLQWFSEVEIWKAVWVPLLALGFAWLTSTFKAKSEAGVEQRKQLDARMDSWMTAQKAEIESLRTRMDAAEGQANRWEGHARRWFRIAHDLRHKLVSARWHAAIVLRNHGETVPQTWEEEIMIPAEIERSDA